MKVREMVLTILVSVFAFKFFDLEIYPELVSINNSGSEPIGNLIMMGFVLFFYLIFILGAIWIGNGVLKKLSL